MEIRDTSQQLLLRFHGRIPTVKSGLSKEKLYVAFAMLGDHAGRHQALQDGNYKVGIAAGQDYYFAEVWCNNFEAAYGVRPHIRDKYPKNIITDVGCKEAGLDLHRHFSFGTYDWNAKSSALKFLLERAKPHWVGYALNAFSEAEGHMAIDKSHGISRRIVIRSVNARGLRRVRPLFGRLGIQTKLYAYYESNYLIISKKENLEKFSAFKGVTSKRKRAKLREALDSYERL